MSGILILVAFVAFAGLMYTRVLPALLALPAMAVAFAALAGVSPAGIGAVVTNGAAALAIVYATVIFGAILGRVTMDTGIAESIVAYAAEFGGDRPLVVCLVLCAAVAALFTSLTGLGAIIMVGSIVLPIMMTVGVPRTIAATTFLLAFAAGFIFNIAEWTFYTTFFGVERGPLLAYAVLLFAVDVAVLLAFAAVAFRRKGTVLAWALPAGDPPVPAKRRAAPWALVAPLLPIVLYAVLHVSAIVAFALAAVYAVLCTKPARAVPVLVSAAIRGLEDVAPAVLLFIGIGMLLQATKTPQVAAALHPVVAAVAPRSALGYIVLFGVLSPLALFRGPLNPYGLGIGVFAVLASLGALPPIALAAAVMAVVQVQNPCDPTNTQNVWVANFTGVPVGGITRLLLPWQTAVATLGCIAVVAFGPSLFGMRFFSAATAAQAATLPTTAPGLFAPPAASHVLGVVAHEAAAQPAAQAIAAQVAGGWTGFRIVTLSAVPAMVPCTNAPYAATLDVTLSTWRGVGTVTTDVGLALDDCAGWSVDEWHEQRTTAQPLDRDAVQTLGMAALFRLRTWTVDHPGLARALFTTGLAYVPGESPPTYLYTLFKTDDGNMRAYVRPGGPAYAAGLRTNDIVDKLDGQWWWEYGTYQTQARAYDGKPHTFEVTRGKDHLTIRLGAPLA